MLLYSGFLFSIFLDYVRPGSYLPIIQVAKLNSVVPLTVLFFTIFHKSDVSDQEIFSDRNSRWLLFFLVLLLISMFTADVTLYSYNTLTTVLGFVFWYYIIVKLVTTERRMRALFTMLVLSHVLLLVLNPQLITHPEMRSSIQGNTFLGDGNDYSLSATIAMPMCLYLILHAKALWIRLFWGVMLVALILGVVGTQSRGATIALACVFLFLWWKGRQKITGLALIALLVTGIVSYAPDVYFERIDTIAHYQEEGSAMGRIEAWNGAMRMAAKYPILGVGSGHFAASMAFEFRPPDLPYNKGAPAKTAHSMYFLLIGELGIPGIIFLLAVLISNYLRNNRLMREARDRRSELSTLFMMLNASLVAFAVGGAFLSVAYYPHLYVLIGIWTAANFIYMRTLSERQEATPEETPEQRAERLIWGDGNGKQLDVTR